MSPASRMSSSKKLISLKTKLKGSELGLNDEHLTGEFQAQELSAEELTSKKNLELNTPFRKRLHQ